VSIDHPLSQRRARSKGKGHARSKGRGHDRSNGPGRGRSTTTRRGAARRRIVAAGRRRARLLALLVVVAALLGGGWLWLRGSSFVRVTRVQVTGVTSSAEPRIDAALDAAARGMTTMRVDEAALRQAVAAFPSVAGLRVSTDFPHGMTIEVLERRPVAALVAGDQRIAVTGDGRLLRDVQDTMGLPAVTGASLPGAARVGAPRARAALTVAAAAPPGLRRRSQSVGWGRQGLQVELTDGPPLIFGSADHAAGKWAAAARVLADPSAAGATYLDLRVPGRVAAGGLDPVVAEDAQGDAVDPAASATPAPVPTAVATPTATATPYSQP
jgi:cell division protein FtsQ